MTFLSLRTALIITSAKATHAYQAHISTALDKCFVCNPGRSGTLLPNLREKRLLPRSCYWNMLLHFRGALLVSFGPERPIPSASLGLVQEDLGYK